MSARSSLNRVHALRRLQEERVEAELRAVHQQQQLCVTAAGRCRLETRDAAQAMFAALEAGQCESLVAASVSRALGSLRQGVIAQQLIQTNASVDDDALRWQAARVARRQLESVLAAEQRRVRLEAETKEQKRMDGWFLMCRPIVETEQGPSDDESSQRLPAAFASVNGNALAKSRLR